MNLGCYIINSECNNKSAIKFLEHRTCKKVYQVGGHERN